MKRNLILLALLITVKIANAQMVEYVPDSMVKKHVIKVEFFSPLNGNLTFGYEQYLKNFTSIEAKVGIIGIGNQKEYNGKGAFLKVGPKFKLKPDYAVKGTFGTHLLRGGYIRPEVAFSAFSDKQSGYYDYYLDKYYEGENINVFSGALLINYGRQHVLGDIMTIDYYVGLGYGFSNHDEQNYYYGYFAGTSSTPIALNAGFTLGFIY